MTKAYLSIENLDVVFNAAGRRSEVLRGVDLQVQRGEFVSIIGHSGCGKSTLLNVVAGLLPVTTGAVILDGVAVEEPGPDRAVVFQNHSLLPWLNVYENVRLAVEQVFRHTKSRTERHAWTLHNLALVQMGHARDKKPSEISGGMKQRVGIARALAMEPKVLLLDEPFGALDALTREQMNVELHRIWRESGITVLFVTHSIPEAVYLGTRVVVMSPRPGRIVEEIHVDLPASRDYTETMNSPVFASLTGHIRTMFGASGHLD